MGEVEGVPDVGAGDVGLDPVLAAHAGSVMSWVLNQSLMPAARRRPSPWPGVGTSDRVVEEVPDDVAVGRSVTRVSHCRLVPEPPTLSLVGRVRPEVLRALPARGEQGVHQGCTSRQRSAQPAPYATSGNVEPF